MLQNSEQMRADEFLRQARCLVERDRYGSALLVLDQAIQCAPSAQLYDYRGVISCLLGQREEALTSFAQALLSALSPHERAAIYFHRGLLYGREEAYDQALLDVTRASRLSPADPTYREALQQIKLERATRTRNNALAGGLLDDTP